MESTTTKFFYFVSEDANPNYLARVVRVEKIKPVEGADRIEAASICGFDVVVGKGALRAGDRVVYFPVESQISKTILARFNLFTNPEKNLDPKAKPGFFGNDGRVRAVEFKGVISCGFALPLATFVGWGMPPKQLDIGEGLFLTEAGYSSDALLYADVEQGAAQFAERSVFDSVTITDKNGRTHTLVLVRKYAPSFDKDKPPFPGAFDRVDPHWFDFNGETEMLSNNFDAIDEDSTLAITKKYHGVAGFTAYTKVNRKTTFLERLKHVFGWPLEESEFGWLYGSNNRVLNRWAGVDTPNDEYKAAHEAVKHWLQYAVGERLIEGAGFIAYYEIVGFTPTGRAIQKGYDYGCAPGTFKVKIYRAVLIDKDGERKEVDESDRIPNIQKYKGWIHARTEVDLPLRLFKGPACALGQNGKEIYEGLLYDKIPGVKTGLTEKDDECENPVPTEGVVVHVLNEPFKWNPYKVKSLRFLKRETEELDHAEKPA
jgi:hypothetical protein